MFRRAGQAVALVLALAILAVGCTSGGGGGGGGGGGKGPILIGFPADLSATYSYYDQPINDGAKFAIDEINAAGGVLGRKLELKTLDQRNDVAETTKVTQQLIGEGASYLVGTTGDGILSEGQLGCKAGIPVSTGDGTAPTLVGDMGSCAFQLVMSDNVQGAVDAEYALKQGYKTAYLIGSNEIPYTQNLPKYFEETFAKGGGTVVGRDTYKIGSGDYSAAVTKLANASPQPDVVFTPMFPPDTQVFLRQLRQAGVTLPVLSTDGNFDVSLKEAGAAALNGFVFTASACPPEPGTEMQSFFTKFQQATGKEPSSVVVALGYDEMYALKTAIEQAGSADPAAIIKALDTVDYTGVTGEIAMDPQTRRAKKPAALILVKGTKFTCLGTFYPEFVPAP